MSPRTRTALAVSYFALATLALVAPAWTWWGNHIEPRVAGLPWSLVSVLIVIACNFAVLLALWKARWIDDREALEEATPPAQPPGEGEVS